MNSEIISPEQVLIALERVDGGNFEKFFHSFYPSFAGDEFVPLGGPGDGGADAFLGETVFLGKQSGCYYQSSILEDYRAKIRRTINRLREFGRNPNTLIYVTSKRIKHIDIEEAKLSEELNVNIKIRDGSYIASNVNYSNSTRAAFMTYLKPQLDYLKFVGGSTFSLPPRLTNSPAVYVFLRQEIERRHGKGGLINALSDGLILWALEGTDPEQDKFLTEREIITKIEETIPSARTLLRGAIPNRLLYLSTKVSKSERPIRWYRKQGKYCLSYEIRRNIETENTEDEALQFSVIDAFNTRLAEKFGDNLSPEQRNIAVKLSLCTLHRTFEDEGVEFATFLKSQITEAKPKTLSDHVDGCLIENNISQGEFGVLKEAIIENLRGAFYDSTPEERLFFTRLSSTYTLLFCLNTEPRIVEYFQSMASDFYLYIGSDILIKALSEKYLRPEDQLMTNTLNIIREAGGKLVLTEHVLNEVFTHIEAADYEYVNNYQRIDHLIDNVIARNINRILIRAYFYARIIPPAGVVPIASWQMFVKQFCDYNFLHRPEGREQIRVYLQAKFQMEYITSQEISRYYDPQVAEELSRRLAGEKKDPRLAMNDAILTLSVYGRREMARESSRVSEFGYRTWWLTGESRILKHTEHLVQTYGARYMIRPEFLLNFITLAPSAAQVRRTYRTIFPSILGIQLARRVDPSELTKVIQKVQESLDLEPARLTAVVSGLSNQLKGDFTKCYDHTLGITPSESEKETSKD